jgi:hypothetical protein
VPESANSEQRLADQEEPLRAVAKSLGNSLDEVIEDLVVPSIAMGGLTVASRPKAPALRLVGTNGDS